MTTKIYYKYGCMNSGKSLDLIKIAFNYKENNINTLNIKPIIDNRKVGKIASRTGLEIDAYELNQGNHEEIKTFLEEKKGKFDVLLVEECNFFSKESIDTIIDFAYNNDIKSVLFFGIKVDFRGDLFEGSRRVIERADKIEEATSICWCGKKARQNARVVNNKITKDGPTILIENNETVVEYVTLCNYHYYKEDLGYES